MNQLSACPRLIRSHSRSTIKVGAITWLWNFLLSLVFFGVLYFIFMVVGWSGVLGYFGGNLFLAALGVIGLIVLMLIISFWILGFAARRGVGVGVRNQ